MFGLSRLRLALCAVAAVLALAIGAQMLASAAALKKARHEAQAERTRADGLKADLAAARAEARALSAGLEAVGRREQRAQPIIVETREAIANAPETNACAGSPAIRAALAGVLRLDKHEGPDPR